LNLKITSLQNPSASPHTSELRKLLEKEWNDFDAFSEHEAGHSTPAPIVAIEKGMLVGPGIFLVAKSGNRGSVNLDKWPGSKTRPQETGSSNNTYSTGNAPSVIALCANRS